MSQYRIFTHPEHGVERVKDGFSWPGFFFNFGWALYKNLWMHGIVLAVLVGGSRIASIYHEAQYDNNPEALSPISAMVIGGAGLILLLSCICVGWFGNRWVEQNLLHRGYTYTATEENTSRTN